MKLINNKELSLSKDEWVNIGKTAGFIDESFTFKNNEASKSDLSKKAQFQVENNDIDEGIEEELLDLITENTDLVEKVDYNGDEFEISQPYKKKTIEITEEKLLETNTPENLDRIFSAVPSGFKKEYKKRIFSADIDGIEYIQVYTNVLVDFEISIHDKNIVVQINNVEIEDVDDFEHYVWTKIENISMKLGQEN